MGMFCYQCQETAGGKGCTVKGVCGKNEEVAKLQDLLIYTLKGISEIVVKGKVDITKLDTANYDVLSSLFMTRTNANFDDGRVWSRSFSTPCLQRKCRMDFVRC